MASVTADHPPSAHNNGELSSEKVPSGEVTSAHGDGSLMTPNGPLVNDHPNGESNGAAVDGEKTIPKDEHFPAVESAAQSANGDPPENQTPIFSNETVDGSTNPVFTIFKHPHPSATLPTPTPLTPDQETKYTSLLTTVRTWTTIPTSKKPPQDRSALTPAEKFWLTRECLLRYLRASKWSVPTAQTRLLDTLTWRREYGVDQLTADYISEENETGKQVILGYDNQGRPCLYLNPHKQNTKGQKKQIQHVVFMVERCIDLMAPGVENHALIVNFTESRKGQNATVGQAREILSIIQNHYPERLGRALVQEVPWLVWGFFKAISPFIDPVTREKLKFDEDLRGLVPPGQLLKRFGGDVEFEYVHGRYWPALNEEAGRRRGERLGRWERGGGLVGESEFYLGGVGKSDGAAAKA